MSLRRSPPGKFISRLFSNLEANEHEPVHLPANSVQEERILNGSCIDQGDHQQDKDDQVMEQPPPVVNLAVMQRTPHFWRHDPELWFTQLESAFARGHINGQLSRAREVVALMDEELLRAMRPFFLLPEEERTYNTIKQMLMDRYSLGDQQRIRRLDDLRMDGRLPSEFWAEMLIAADGTPEDRLFRIWKSRLPQRIQEHLLHFNGARNEAPAFADSFVQIAETPMVAAVRSSSSVDSSRLEIIEKKLEQLTKLLAKANLGNNPIKAEKDASFKQRPRFSNDDNDTIGFCWYHSKFGVKATKCNNPCSYATSQSKN